MRDLEDIKTVEEVNSWEIYWLNYYHNEIKESEKFSRKLSRSSNFHRAPDIREIIKRIEDVKREARWRIQDIKFELNT